MAQGLAVVTLQNITRIVGTATGSGGTLKMVVFVADPLQGSRYRLKVLRLNNASSISKDYVALQRLSGVTATGGTAPGNVITASTLVQNVWESSLPAGPSQDQTNLGDEFRCLAGEVLGVVWIAGSATSETNAGYVFELTLYHAV